MKNKLIIAVFLVFALLGQSLPARADADSAPMPKPPEVTSYVHAKTAYGQATLHKLFMKIYDTSLWTDAKTWSTNEVFALSIRYNMNFTVKELVDRSFEEMERVAPVTDSDRAAFVPALKKVMHDVHPGDVITAVYLPKKGAVFYYNGTRTGNLEDRAFSQRFLNIWLGPGTSEPQVRKDLLAQK